MRSRSPGRLWSVNRKLAAARWTFTADLTLMVRGCDGVAESTVQAVQINQCVQGCATHNCRTREALNHIAVGRAVRKPSCLGELPSVLQQRPHLVLLQRTQIFHIVPVLSVPLTFIQPQHEVLQIRIPCAWAAPTNSRRTFCVNTCATIVVSGIMLGTLMSREICFVPCDVIPTVIGLLFMHVGRTLWNFFRSTVVLLDIASLRV